jgi:predicted ATP-dependent endonuclease of OLD family
MLLTKVVIEGYRSVRDAVELHVDPRATVVLGANDHGKSNLLAALLHLNPDHGFDAEDDLNWDRIDEAARLPMVEFTLSLDDEERRELLDAETWTRYAASLGDFIAETEHERDVAAEELAEATKGVAAATTARDEAATAVQEVSETAEPSVGDVASRQREYTEMNRRAGEAAATEEKRTARVAELNRTVALARARQIEAEAGARAEATDTAVAHALSKAATAQSTAGEAEERAAARVQTATQQFESVRTSYAEGTPELELAKKAVSSAEGARRAAGRELQRREAELAAVSAAAQARDGEQTSPDNWKGLGVPTVQKIPQDTVPAEVVAARHGVASDLQFSSESELTEGLLDAFAVRRLPRVQLIRPVEKVPDSVTREQLDSDEAVFMRGIFHYAGIAPAEWESIFVQDNFTLRRLADASAELDATLRKSWTQGSKLSFILGHNSRSKRIELRLKDPAVERQYVLASKRSSGFTHFFALKTILYAHQTEAPAKAYIWVFDEPGIYLHPDGQHDLVKVMETLAQTNQVVYSTHSIFMANKNFPARHRLVLKTTAGTRIDGKPFRSRWRPAIAALGMSMPGTVLFASHVLLVEGDSDAILINAVLQKLLAAGLFSHDVNALGVMSAGDAPDAAALVRILTEGAMKPRIAALFDGDEGGRKRADAIDHLAKANDVPVRLLTPSETTTEDHLPAALDLYPIALASYITKMATSRGDTVDSAAVLESIRARVDELDVSKEELTKGMSRWSRTVGMGVGGLDDKPSPVGVAREYAVLLDSTPMEQIQKSKRLSRALDLAKWIAATLDLPPLTLAEDAPLEEPLPADDLA